MATRHDRARTKAQLVKGIRILHRMTGDLTTAEMDALEKLDGKKTKADLLEIITETRTNFRRPSLDRTLPRDLPQG